MMFIELQCIRIALQLQQKPTVKISEHIMIVDLQVRDETRLHKHKPCVVANNIKETSFGKAQVLQYQLVKIVTNFKH